MINKQRWNNWTEKWWDNSVSNTTQNVAWQINIDAEINTLSKWNSSVSYLPETWGHIVSCVIDGVELFHDMFADSNKPKGWMPYMFPNAGPLTQDEKDTWWIDLEQHGFWRTSSWSQILEWVQELSFISTVWYPYKWIVRNEIEMCDDGWVIFHHYVTNQWDCDIPISSGLHPYFNIPTWNKSKINWKIQWWDNVKNDIDIWSEWWTWEYNVPADKKIVFTIPDIWEISLELSGDYKKFWVWSLEDKDFVCVEPVMNSVWWIVKTPVIVKPGETNHNWMKIMLRK
jgi:galactose mutarotase-like enzyme